MQIKGHPSVGVTFYIHRNKPIHMVRWADKYSQTVIIHKAPLTHKHNTMLSIRHAV